MTSHSNITLHYVEVLYMKGVNYLDRKFNHYPESEASQVYTRTVNKFTEDKSKNVIVTLREENHTILKSFKNYI